MVLLRSREVPPLAKPNTTQKPPRPTKPPTPEPPTPTQTREPTPIADPETPQLPESSSSGRRRSQRLASKSVSDDGNGGPRKRKDAVGVPVGDAASVFDNGAERDGDEGSGKLSGVFSLRSGKRVVKRRVGYGNGIEKSFNRKDMEGEEMDFGSGEENGSVQHLGASIGELALDEKLNAVVGNVGDDAVNRKRSEEDVIGENLEKYHNCNESSSCRGRRRRSREEKGKGKVLNDASVSNTEDKGEVGLESELQSKVKELVDSLAGGKVLEDERNKEKRRRYSRQEKGKKKMDGGNSSVLSSKGARGLEVELESKVKDLVDSLEGIETVEDGRKGRKGKSKETGKGSRMEQFRDIARKSASRFAHFEVEEQDEDHSTPEADLEMPSAEEEQKVEDWPGPFSTAMKIIRDREIKLCSQQGTSTAEKEKSVPIMWVPRKDQMHNRSKALIPSLAELSLKVLVKNADSITSLDNIPDALRHRICQSLCDSSRMNSHFLDLLIHGSPTEVRIKDCSWLTEEEFIKYFESCCTKNLMVLQLDQCGRCMPDYILLATLARSPRSLPALTTLSLVGSCRLSDVGLRSLVSSAPALRSINLSQCSLLTSSSIYTLADSLGSLLQELYINDCESIDAMLILPALKTFEHLEVLSVARMLTVCDKFVRDFIAARGQNIKELFLTDCVKLTDSSLKVIAENCSGLRALDIVNLKKLTDAALGYLANGCQEIQMLKLCRNAFSDEAVAAFLEASGETLRELSLNNVKTVGNNTAISLARRARNVLYLDLSWCRNLTDEAVGLIVDSCSSLRVVKLFGCRHITNVFLDGHSNPRVQIIGLQMTPLLEHLWVPEPEEFRLHYSSSI